MSETTESTAGLSLPWTIFAVLVVFALIEVSSPAYTVAALIGHIIAAVIVVKGVEYWAVRYREESPAG